MTKTDKASVDLTLRKSAHHVGHDLLRRAAESQFRHHTGHEPPKREQLDFGEVDAGSFGRLRVRHHIAHAELSIAGVTSDVDDLDTDLRGAFVRASSDYMDSLEEMQASAKATIGALVAAILSRHGHIADAVRRMRFRERYVA